MPTPVVTVQNWGDAVFLALSNVLNMLLSAIPLVIGALVILVIGWILASIGGRVATAALNRLGADRLFRLHGENVYGATVTTTWSPSVVSGEVVKWLIRLVFLVAAAVLNIALLRRRALTDQILALYRRILPDMSQTEKEAIDAGTVWWDGDLFSGKPNWDKLLATPAPRLSAEERARARWASRMAPSSAASPSTRCSPSRS